MNKGTKKWLQDRAGKGVHFPLPLCLAVTQFSQGHTATSHHGSNSLAHTHVRSLAPSTAWFGVLFFHCQNVTTLKSSSPFQMAGITSKAAHVRGLPASTTSFNIPSWRP